MINRVPTLIISCQKLKQFLDSASLGSLMAKLAPLGFGKTSPENFYSVVVFLCFL
jgi:hypothetical protein